MGNALTLVPRPNELYIMLILPQTIYFLRSIHKHWKPNIVLMPISSIDTGGTRVTTKLASCQLSVLQWMPWDLMIAGGPFYYHEFNPITDK